MQPCRNVVQHLIPWDAHVISIQVENAALELSALGTAVHIPLEVDMVSRRAWLFGRRNSGVPTW